MRCSVFAVVSVGVVVAALLAARLPPPERRRETVVVIGGGLSGLVAATELGRAAGPSGPSFDVVVVEAQGRLGGRVVDTAVFADDIDNDSGSNEENGNGKEAPKATQRRRRRGLVEIGATFIHGAAHNPVQRLADFFGLRTAAIDYGSVAVFEAGAAPGAAIPAAAVDAARDRWFVPARAEALRRRDRLAAAARRDVPLQALFDAALQGAADAAAPNDGTTQPPAGTPPATSGLLARLPPQERSALSWHFFWEIVQDQIARVRDLSSFEYDASLAFRGPDRIFVDGSGALVEALSADFLASAGAVHAQAQQQQTTDLPRRAVLLSSPVVRLEARAVGTEALLGGGSNARRGSDVSSDGLVSVLLSPWAALARVAGWTRGTAAAASGERERASRQAQRRAKFGGKNGATYLPDADPAGHFGPAADDAASSGAASKTPRGSHSTGEATAFDGLTVHIKDRSEAIDADRVVLTIPLGVLAAVDSAALRSPDGPMGGAAAAAVQPRPGEIQFVPSLPKWKRAAATELGCGATIKVALQFHDRCWDSQRQFFGVVGDPSYPGDFLFGDGDHLEVFNLDFFRGNKVLIVEAEGAFAARLSTTAEYNANHTAMVVTEILPRLRPIFSATPAGACPLRRVAVNNYIGNPYIRCGFSYWPPGRSGADNLALRDPLFDNRLFFAGEHTTPDYYGNMHGAISEGQRAARMVIDAAEADAARSPTFGVVGEWVLALWRQLIAALVPSRHAGTAAKFERHRRTYKPGWCPAPCQ